MIAGLAQQLDIRLGIALVLALERVGKLAVLENALRDHRLAAERRLIVLRAQGVDPSAFRQAHAYTRHPAARTFQALRVAVNREDEALAQLLRDLPWILRPGGRAAILAFHSGEERRVEEAFAAGRAAGLYAQVSATAQQASPQERRRNPRSRSARLRWALRA